MITFQPIHKKIQKTLYQKIDMLSKNKSITIGIPTVKPTDKGSVPPPNENYMLSRAVWTRAVSFTPLKGYEPVILMGGELNSAGNMASAFSTAANHGMHLGLTGGNTFSDYDMLWDRGGKYNRASGEMGASMPYRPMPGIKDISIEYKGGGMKLGATRTAELNWVCWTWEELNRLIPHFLHHGRTVLLEWGWTGESTTLRDIQPYPLFTKNENNHLIFKLDQDDNSEFGTKDIISKLPSYILKQNGHYDAMLGIVQNFTWTVRDDGGFDCVTTLISPGVSTLQQNFKSSGEDNLAFLPVLSSPVKGWFKDSAKMDKLFEGETITEGDLSDNKLPNQMFMKLMPYVNFRTYISDLPDQAMHNYSYNEPTRLSASIIMINPFEYKIYAAKGTDFTAGITTVRIDPAVSNPELEEGQSYQPLFVTWGWVEDNVLSRFFSSVGRDAEGNLKTIGTFRSIEHQYNQDGTEVRNIFKEGESTTSPTEEQQEFLYTGNFPQSTKMRRSAKMLTVDTSKWILFNNDFVSEKIRQNVAAEDEKVKANVRMFSPKIGSNRGGDINGKNNEGLCKEDEGFLRNVYFNVNWLSSVMAEAGTIQNAVMSVWDEFAAVYGGVHRFRIEIEDDGNQVVIRDMGYQGITIKELIDSVAENKTKKDGSIGDMNRLFEFPTWEMGSIVKSQNISAKLPSRMQLAAMYGSNNPDGVMSQNQGGDYDTLAALAWGRLNKPRLPEDANEETLEKWKMAHYEDLIAGKWDSPNLHNRSFGVANAKPNQSIYIGPGDGNQQPVNNGTIVYPSIFNEIDASQTKEVLRRVKDKQEALTEETFSTDTGGRPKTWFEGIADTWPGTLGEAAVVKAADFIGLIDEEGYLKLQLPDIKAAEIRWSTFNPINEDNIDGMYIQSFKRTMPYKIAIASSIGLSTPLGLLFAAWNTASIVENSAIYSIKLAGEYQHAMKRHMMGDREGIGNKTDPIIPIEFELDIDGTGGIFPGNAFQSSYLPQEYKKQTCFQVVGASHKIDSTGWTTTIKGQIRVAMRDLDAIENKPLVGKTQLYNEMTEKEREEWEKGQIEGQTEPTAMENMLQPSADQLIAMGLTPPVVKLDGFEKHGGLVEYIKVNGFPNADELLEITGDTMAAKAIQDWMQNSGLVDSDGNPWYGVIPGGTYENLFPPGWLDEFDYQKRNSYESGVGTILGAWNNWTDSAVANAITWSVSDTNRAQMYINRGWAPDNTVNLDAYNALSGGG